MPLFVMVQINAAILRASGAARPYADSRQLAIEPVRLDPPGPGEVLVAIRAAGLCHSDLSVIDGNRPRPLPMALGHEAAGVVEALGPGVEDLKPGDRVVMVFMPSCGGCVPCATGRPALCEPGAAANGRGELLAVSASQGGAMVGLAVAELFQAADGQTRAELISLRVLPAHASGDMPARLVGHLEKLVGQPLSR